MLLNRLFVNKVKVTSRRYRRKERHNYYYTVVLDIEKYYRWKEARKQNGARVTNTDVAESIGYGKSYMCQLLNEEKYDIEVSGRFIGTFLKTFGLKFEEIFKAVRVCQKEVHQKDKAYVATSNFRRQDQVKLPHTYYAR